MWECDYAKEPIDYRLYFLKMLKKIWILPLAAAIGALITCAVYCFSNLVLGDGFQYRASTMYYITYSQHEDGTESEYYNYYTWQELIYTDYFMDGLIEALDGKYSKEYLISNVSATLESDYRYLYTRSVNSNATEAIEIENALSKLMTEFASERDEIASIAIVKEADLSNVEDISLIFINNATIVGAVVGLIAGIILSIIIFAADTSVYLPSTLEKRYHITSLGAPSMKEYEVNCRYILGNKKVGLIYIGGTGKKNSGLSADKAAEKYDLQKYGLPDSVAVTVLDSPIENPEVAWSISGFDRIVIAVKAGAHNGRLIERTLEQLTRADAKSDEKSIGKQASFKDSVVFALVEEDAGLIKKYYGK